jgi:hypothetical protein
MGGWLPCSPPCALHLTLTIVGILHPHHGQNLYSQSGHVCRWKKFSSAHLNEAPEAPDSAHARGSPYIPQHTVAGGKLQYITTATTSEPAEGPHPLT